MADNGVWFKLWCAADDDADLDNLDVCDYGRWCKFGTYTKRHGTAGIVKVVAPARTLCSKFQVANFDELEAAIMRFPHVTLIEKTVTNAFVTVICKWENWHKYQVDNSTERTRKYRDRVTTKKRREEMRGDEKRKEEVKAPATPPVLSVDPSEKPKRNAEIERIFSMAKEIAGTDKNRARELCNFVGKMVREGIQFGDSESIVHAAILGTFQALKAKAEKDGKPIDQALLWPYLQKTYKHRRTGAFVQESDNHKREGIGKLGDILDKITKAQA